MRGPSAGSCTTWPDGSRRMPITSFWVGEYDAAHASRRPRIRRRRRHHVAEHRAHRRTGDARASRFSSCAAAASSPANTAYRLSSHGLDVFPRLADPIDIAATATAPERMSSGVPALDAMLADGYWRGASTLVAGPSGVGKDTARAAFRLRRRATRRDRSHRNVPGEPDPTRTDPARLLLVAQRSRDRADVPQPGRPATRRMGLRLPRHLGTHRRQQGRHRQPRRPPGRLRRRTPIPRIYLLTPATLRSRQHQRAR